MWKKLLMQALGALVSTITKDGVKSAPGWYSKLKSWWTGKCIAIIGPTASGKNSFFNKLKRENAPTEHIQTRGAEEVGTFKFTWPLPDKTEVDFRCRNSINVGGEVDERERYWLQSCSGADVIFYLIDLDKLSNNPDDTKDRIKSDFKWIASNISHFKANSSIHVLINKVDILLNGCPDPSDIEEKISKGLESYLEDIEYSAKKILGVYFDKITGISPISMIDPHIFSIYFTAVLQTVFKSKAK